MKINGQRWAFQNFSEEGDWEIMELKNIMYQLVCVREKSQNDLRKMRYSVERETIWQIETEREIEN